MTQENIPTPFRAQSILIPSENTPNVRGKEMPSPNAGPHTWSLGLSDIQVLRAVPATWRPARPGTLPMVPDAKAVAERAAMERPAARTHRGAPDIAVAESRTVSARCRREPAFRSGPGQSRIY